ncbi:MAG: hypothetical protein WBH03_01205, partial [Cyclobacteriaceae bacterium]
IFTYIKFLYKENRINKVPNVLAVSIFALFASSTAFKIGTDFNIKKPDHLLIGELDLRGEYFGGIENNISIKENYLIHSGNYNAIVHLVNNNLTLTIENIKFDKSHDLIIVMTDSPNIISIENIGHAIIKDHDNELIIQSTADNEYNYKFSNFY